MHSSEHLKAHLLLLLMLVHLHLLFLLMLVHLHQLGAGSWKGSADGSAEWRRRERMRISDKARRLGGCVRGSTRLPQPS